MPEQLTHLVDYLILNKEGAILGSGNSVLSLPDEPTVEDWQAARERVLQAAVTDWSERSTRPCLASAITFTSVIRVANS